MKIFRGFFSSAMVFHIHIYVSFVRIEYRSHLLSLHQQHIDVSCFAAAAAVALLY